MLKVFSYGGGVQSTAALVLAAQGQIDYRTFLFCNVGEDSEHPETLRYVHEVAMPYAQAHGIDLIELQRIRRNGSVETLYSRLTGEANRGFVIPAYYPTKDDLHKGAPGMRSCTQDFKINVVAKWLREQGATKANPATVGLGISLDEWHRARNESGISYEKLAYPLLDLRLSRQDCLNIIQQANLPIPPRSNCWFCPYHPLPVWQKMRQNQPTRFGQACQLEQILQQRQQARGLPMVYLTSKMRPLAQVTTDHIQGELFEDDEQAVCESGYCFL